MCSLGMYETGLQLEQTHTHTPTYNNGVGVQHELSSFRFLGVPISNNLTHPPSKKAHQILVSFYQLSSGSAAARVFQVVVQPLNPGGENPHLCLIH